MSFASQSKKQGKKLSLGWFAPRQTWKKMYRGKMMYFKEPNTKAGYESALAKFHLAKIQATEERPNVNHWRSVLEQFQQVQSWYDRFGVPSNEKKLAAEVSDFVEWLKVQMEAVHLSETIPLYQFTDQGKPEFVKEFGFAAAANRADIGDCPPLSLTHTTNAKWAERLERLEEQPTKHPQTIGYWLDQLDKEEASRLEGHTLRVYRSTIKNFKNYADLNALVSSIDFEYSENYHTYLNKCALTKKTKKLYHARFIAFVDFCNLSTQCDFDAPKRRKKKRPFIEPGGTQAKRMARSEMAWTPDQIKQLIEVSGRYAPFIALFANCGFRHSDVANLRHDQLDLDNGRLIYQRHKKKNSDRSPIVNYKLWSVTIELIKKYRSDDPTYVFLTNRGTKIDKSIESWWVARRPEGFEGRQLKMIRATGATHIKRIDPSVRDLYLANAMTGVGDIHYDLDSGKPLQRLDDALDQWGAMLGYAEEPTRKVELTPEMLEVLRGAGLV